MAEAEKKYKITIVDDDDFLVNMYATKFGLSGVSADVYKSGESFLTKLKGGIETDLILLDIVIPDISGIDILKKMRKDGLAANIPVVMLTNQNDERDISEAKMLDVAGYIVKSAATPSEVVTEVMKILKSEKNKK